MTESKDAVAESNNWVDRVNGLMANSVHEQLRVLIEGARAEVERFSIAVAQQATKLDEGQRELHGARDRLDGIQRTLDEALAGAREQVAEGVRAALAEITGQLETDRAEARARQEAFVRQAADATTDVRAALVDVRAEIEQIAERAAARDRDASADLRSAFAESNQRMREQFATQSDHILDEVGTLVGSVEQRLSSLAQEVADLRARVDGVEESAASKVVATVARALAGGAIEERPDVTIDVPDDAEAQAANGQPR